MTIPLHPPTERSRPSRRFKRIAIGAGFVFMLTTALTIGYAIGWFDSYGKSSAMIERTLVMTWGDGAYGTAYYGAHVFAVPEETGWSVRAQVLIGGPEALQRHDCGEIARVNSWENAVAAWSRAEWREDGLHIGSSEGNTYFLPRRRIESHR